MIVTNKYTQSRDEVAMLLKDCQLLLRVPDCFGSGDFISKFHQRNRFICALYARHFCVPPNARGIKARGWKIVVECMDSVARRDCWLEGGVLMQQVTLDYPQYALSEARVSQMMALDALHRGVVLAATSEGLDTSCFDAAYAAVVGLDFVNEWIWPRRVASPNRRWHGFLVCRQDAEQFVGTLVVDDRSGQVVASAEAVRTGPSEFQFVPRLGPVRWVKPTRVAMLSATGEEVVALDADASSGT